jgi:hypothetical protein
LGFGVGEFFEHEKDEDRSIDELEEDRRGKRIFWVGLVTLLILTFIIFPKEDRYRDDYGGGYGGDDDYEREGTTTVINEDGGFFGDDRQTTIQTGIWLRIMIMWNLIFYFYFLLTRWLR